MIVKNYYLLRKQLARKTGKPVSCFWRLVPTPGWMLSILDAIFDPQNVEEEEKFNIKRDTEESSIESEKPAHY